MSEDTPKIIEGGLGVDDRGSVTFANDFNFADVKRFYMIENVTTDVIRAWHGHENEAKYMLVVDGSAIIAAVKMDDKEKPSKDNEINRFVLSAKKPQVLYIPAGYANGLKSLELGTKIMVFSTSTLDQSKGDDYRFPADYWGEDVWKTEHR